MCYAPMWWTGMTSPCPAQWCVMMEEPSLATNRYSVTFRRQYGQRAVETRVSPTGLRSSLGEPVARRRGLTRESFSPWDNPVTDALSMGSIISAGPRGSADTAPSAIAGSLTEQWNARRRIACAHEGQCVGREVITLYSCNRLDFKNEDAAQGSTRYPPTDSTTLASCQNKTRVPTAKM